jgi:tetratricopeptide (TPR) repeat protein
MTLNYILAFAWSQNSCQLWDVEGARKVLTQFVAVDPADRLSRLALATSYRLTGQLDEAEAVLRPLSDSDQDACALRADLAVERGDVEAAEKLVRLGPADHVRLNALRGRLSLQAGNPDQAAGYFRAALRQDPEDRDSIQGLGVALRKLRDPKGEELLRIAFVHDQLKRTIQESVTTIGTDTKLFYKLGDLSESLGRLEEARVWYQIAVGRDPLDTLSQQGLSRVTQAIAGKSTESSTKRTNSLETSKGTDS